MSEVEREVTCGSCKKDPATCVSQADQAFGYGLLVAAMCSTCCDHKAPHRCLPIVRYERGKEFDT